MTDKIKGYCYTIITFPIALFASIAFSLLCLLGELDEKRRIRIKENEKNKSYNSHI